MAMSGGIDSTVAAMLLLEQGYELVGCTFRTYDSIKESCLAREKGCCSVESIMEAKHMAERLGFPHHIVDFRDVFRREVIGNFISEYLHGRTPNPCVLCNSHIKWGVLTDVADQYGCDYIATGHYARIAEHDSRLFLRTAVDTRKDQTYFLWMLTQDNLRRTLFPLGAYTKPEVRAMAAERGYVRLSQKVESQDICFVPDGDYRAFLTRECSPDDCARAFAQGDYVDAEGRVLGRHSGYANYTIGQRKGLGVALGEPAYVTRIDPDANTVTLGRHDDLLTCRIPLRDVRFFGDPSQPILARIRYRSAPILATWDATPPPTTATWDAGSLSRSQTAPANRRYTATSHSTTATLRTAEPVWGVTPGQSCVLYQDELLVGGGIISVAPNEPGTNLKRS
ncbi:MAG: tRNA 2-thiouridine(34) synthase MnmA [Paludibacteraceae bacterium]|nr:tRNA 2-thiouridine(34) synthase MnmA [Paludibacteraceae bacterium]